jgi:trimethyllysine dioxygenase
MVGTEDAHARAGPETAVAATLRVEWEDGHESHFPAEWLLREAYDDAAPGAAGLGARPKTITGGRCARAAWDTESAPALATVSTAYDTFAISARGSPDSDADIGMLSWMDDVAVHGFGIVTGVPANAEATEALCAAVAPLKNTHFEPFWVFTADMGADDLAYTNVALPPHHDGTYYEAAPGIQIFHCLEPATQGGDTTLVDGLACAERLRAEDPRAFEILSTTPIPCSYTGDRQLLVMRSPIILCGEDGSVETVRYNNEDRDVLDLPFDQVMPFYDALASFARIVDDPAMLLTLRLTPGSVIAIDNRRVMHGRTSFSGGTRTLCGCYIDEDFWRSRHRALIHENRRRHTVDLP